MKKLLTLIFLLNTVLCTAQNYKCLQNGSRHFFTNSAGYLRGISIDSVNVIAADTVYYPYKTPRVWAALMDSSNGSWLGSKVIEKADGTFLFNTAWRDTIFMKTQATPGDTWIFYNDTSSRWYKATLVSADTMTFLGITDSVKRISIAAYVGATLTTSDSVNSFEIIISKNNGFVRAFDLYLFPYHKPNTTTFSPGIDPFLWEVNGGYTFGIIATNFLFSLADYHKPTKLEIYDFNVGDVFMTQQDLNDFCGIGYSTTNYDSVVGKTIISPYETKYDVYRKSKHETIPVGPYPHYFSYSTTPHMYIPADTSVFSEFVNMPESMGTFSRAYYYLPNDTTHCVVGPLYNHKLIITFEGCPYSISYKVGFEDVQRLGPYATSCPPQSIIGCGGTAGNVVFFSKKAGISCGFRQDVSAVGDVMQTGNFSLCPNPVTDALHITTSGKIFSVSVYNLMGQLLLTETCNTKDLAISVAAFPSGIYLIRLNDEKMVRFIKE